MFPFPLTKSAEMRLMVAGDYTLGLTRPALKLMPLVVADTGVRCRAPEIASGD